MIPAAFDFSLTQYWPPHIGVDMMLVYFLAVVFVATLIRSTFGFGESLVGVPLLLLTMPIETVVPLFVLLSITIAGIVVAQDHRQIHITSAKWLIMFAILGIPVGLAVLVYGNERVIKTCLALVIVGYSTYSLLGKKGVGLVSDNMGWLFACGFISGILGGAYGLSGPPLIVYGNLRKWSAEHFRATLQAYFLPTGILGMIGYASQGLLTWKVTFYFLIALPVAVPAVLLGRFFNSKLKDSAFTGYVHAGLICTGTLLLIQSLGLLN